MLTRRSFLKGTGAAAGLAAFGGRAAGWPRRSPLRIASVDADFEREPLVRPFGFKGGFMTEIWQTAALVEDGAGTRRVGLGTQNVLWSDADVFAAHTESGGNALMYALTERALQVARGQPFETPVDLLDGVLDEVYDYGRRLTSDPGLRKTFALNALVALDNAAWLLYAAEHGIDDFDALVPEAYRPALSYRHDRVAAVPAIAYGIPLGEVEQAADDGYFVMKVKLGHPGTQAEMLERDKARLTEIHRVLDGRRTRHTPSGRLPYYLDANGRYEDKEALLRLLDHARAIGAFDQIAIVEEPFPEEADIEVGDVGVVVAADESAHTDEDAVRRIEMGYGAVALKAIAKTLSMTMKIARVAYERGVPCFCADLTVNPILVDWNKNVAARLAPFPGFDVGLMETNGHQNYAGWERMESYHPYPEAPWRAVHDGVFELGDDFYARSGGIFAPSPHYQAMFS